MCPSVHGINYKTKELALISLFASLTFIGSLIQIPMYPAPITLQSFFVMLSGFLLGPIGGIKSQLAYIFMGLVGLPVFTGGGGIGYILDPRFGFILGFIALAYFCGLSGSRAKNNTPRNIAYTLLGTVVLYLVGSAYIWIIMNHILDLNPSFLNILKGMVIFIPGDIIKIIVTISLVAKLRHHIYGLKD